MAEPAAKKKGETKSATTATRDAEPSDAEPKAQIVRPKRPMKKGMACLDLVEDRQRARLIGVMMIFSFYVLLQSALQSSSDPAPDPIVGEFAFSSTLRQLFLPWENISSSCSSNQPCCSNFLCSL